MKRWTGGRLEPGVRFGRCRGMACVDLDLDLALI